MQSSTLALVNQACTDEIELHCKFNYIGVRTFILPGTGKSVTLRILAEGLEAKRDAKVGILSRPQAGLTDFYREMGELFGVELRPANRWGGAKLRPCEAWLCHDEIDGRPTSTPLCRGPS